MEGRPLWPCDVFHPRSKKKCDQKLTLRKKSNPVENLIDKLSDLLEEAKQRLLALGWFDLPQVPIHGDYCQFNCRFEGDQVVGVVDWDHARMGSRLMDIAHAINIGLGWRGSIDYHEDFLWRDAVVPSRETFINWLIAYHHQAPPLTDVEIQILPLICAALWPAPSIAFVPTNDNEVVGCNAMVDYMQHYLDKAEDISKALVTYLKNGRSNATE